MRLIAYIRVSKVGKREGDSFQSPDQQRDAITHAVALMPGAEIADEIIDLDESGGTMDRPGLARALAMLDANQADGIAVAKLDRFARNASAVEMIESMEKAGKVFVSAADRFDTKSPVGRFALGMMVLVAKLERDRHIETWGTSTRRAVERGVHTVVPYGYRRSNGKGSSLELDDAQAPVVRRMFSEHAAGKGIAGIAAGLNDDGIPASRSPEWTRQAVRALLRTRAYLGEARYGEHVTVDAHPAIVTPDEWSAAQPKRGTWKRNGDSSLLSGLVRCAGCGYLMGAGTNGRAMRRYNCNRHHATGTCPSPTTAPADTLEELVESVFLARHGHERGGAGRAEDPAVAQTAAHLERVEREYVTWRDDVTMREAIGDDDYRDGLLARKAAVDDAMDAYQSAVRAAEANNLAVAPKDYLSRPTSERREILKCALDEVVVRRAPSTRTPLPERVDLVWAG